MSDKKKVFISFSGGRTSALMTKFYVEKYRGEHEIVVLFANTGLEHPNTLKFVDQCDKHFGWGVVWIEAEFHMDHGVGATPKVVTYETASLDGEPFLGFIRTEGLPSPSNPSCTSRLKDRPLHKYVKECLGWKHGSYYTAIGIRADEIDRVDVFYKEKKFMYPLADMGINKEMVKLELMTWPFDLDLPSEAWGNCVACWKKSPRKLWTLAKYNPEQFLFFQNVEPQFRYHKTNKKQRKFRLPRQIYRGHMTTEMLLEEAQQVTFKPYVDDLYLQMEMFDPLLDHSLGCGESCEIGHDFLGKGDA